MVIIDRYVNGRPRHRQDAEHENARDEKRYADACRQKHGENEIAVKAGIHETQQGIRNYDQGQYTPNEQRQLSAPVGAKLKPILWREQESEGKAHRVATNYRRVGAAVAAQIVERANIVAADQPVTVERRGEFLSRRENA